MTRRLTAALSAALLGGGAWLAALTAFRIVDWLVGGTAVGWFVLIGAMVFIFISVVTVDVATDGKGPGNE